MPGLRHILILATAALGALVPAAVAADLRQLLAQAAPGATIDVPPGTYAGPIVIDKPLKLIGHGRPVIDAGGKGDVILIVAPDCEVRGFIIRGSGASLDKEHAGVRSLSARTRIEDNRFQDVLFGIDFKAASDSVIRGNHITSMNLDIARRGDALRLWRCNNCLIENNTIENGRDALLWYSSAVIVRHNVSRHNRYGFHMMFANDITLEDNELSGDSVGVYLMYGRKFVLRHNRLLGNRGPSGYGMGLKEVDSYQISENLFAGNRVGAYLDGSPYTHKAIAAAFHDNTFSCNDVGMALLPAVRGNRIWNNNFIDNIEQVAVMGRGAISGNTFAVGGRGNFWSDYAGYDADRNGVGDFSYRSQKLFENLIDREPKLRLLLFSPAHDAIEFIGRAVPAVQPQPKFTDPSPLMQAVTNGSVSVARGHRGAMLGLAAALLGAAGAVWGCVVDIRRIFGSIGGSK